MLHVALYQPEIPPNTGNIARQCVGMDAHLHLIGPIAFDLSEHAVKRAGLDYWPHLKLTMYDTPEAFVEWLQKGQAPHGHVPGSGLPWLVTKHGPLRYDRVAYRDGDVLIFGAETRGLPPAWLAMWPDRAVHIPMLGPVRSYNLSNAVAVVLAEASREAGIYDRRAERG
jgi:tRNA (cytidine/uridine-2'-O-)-methyltransferase